MDAASLGRNLPSAQAVAANGAIAGANGAAATGVGLMNAGVNQSRVNAERQADTMSGIGSMAGMALRYGTTGGALKTGLFSGNSSDPLSNSNAGTFNRLGSVDDPAFG